MSCPGDLYSALYTLFGELLSPSAMPYVDISVLREQLKSFPLALLFCHTPPNTGALPGESSTNLKMSCQSRSSGHWDYKQAPSSTVQLPLLYSQSPSLPILLQRLPKQEF